MPVKVDWKLNDDKYKICETYVGQGYIRYVRTKFRFSLGLV